MLQGFVEHPFISKMSLAKIGAQLIVSKYRMPLE